MVEIITARLRLRPVSANDVVAFYQILSDTKAMAFWSTPPHKDLAETEAWVFAMQTIDPGDGEDFVIEQNGQVIGKAGLYKFPEVGVILHRAAWGKGYAYEALKPVLERAFDVHGLPSVNADVDPRNSASLRLWKRLGFQISGGAKRTWNVGGEWCDSVYLRLENPNAFVS
jgi:[ribosomal protein S5]-alanine N-acetyltransferase